MNSLEKYKTDGYLIVKNVFTKEFCELIKDSTPKLDTKLTLPFSKIPYGYGDVRNIKPFNQISESSIIKKKVDELVGSKTKLSHFMLVNKAAWIGPDVEWHQEVFNLQIYAPGCDPEKTGKNFFRFL